MSEATPFGIYLHIPYCKAKCRYCDFYSAPGARGVPQSYVDALLRELAKNTRRPDTLYFGGGTHISAYLLKVEPGTAFYRNPPAGLPDGDAAADFYLYAVQQLETAGYRQYEISNFARPGHEGRHNLLYWNCSDYWGVGPAAHSCVGNVRQFWPDDVQGFIAGTVAEQREGDCTSEDYLLMQLRLVSGLNIPAYERRGGRFTAAQRVFMRQCVGHGYAVWDGEVFRLTPAGMVVQNAILEELM